MTTPREATTQENEPTTNKPAAKKPTKKAPAKKAANPKRDERRGSDAGGELVALAKRVGDEKGASTVSTLGAKLADGTITHAQLVTLRDAVRELAGLVRADKPVIARDLANANRAVRRAERASR